MGYANHVTGYRKGLLATRSVVRAGSYAILEPDGLVKNTIPGFENCEVTILGSPKLGASFVDYLLTVAPGGQHAQGFGDAATEVFLYVLEGGLTAWNGEQSGALHAGGYLFSPAGQPLCFANKADVPAKCFLYKRRYLPLAGHSAHTVLGDIHSVPWTPYEGMSDVLIKDFLPAAQNPGFDMNFHILCFKPGACHGYIETHVQEHGAYIYAGEGLYYLDDQWFPVQKGDYLFMGAYCPQAAYAIGRDEDFAYIYSKDCNRDAVL